MFAQFKVFLLGILCFLGSLTYAQNYKDTLFQIKTDSNVRYGSMIDFAGRSVELNMDISYPLGDTVPLCGRPLLVLVHGGAWIAGDKDQGYVKRMREDFAKRGYTTASVSYRLGQFHTNRSINCNVSGWNCWNMTDTIEWYRAYYRAIQDVNGAIRFLVKNADSYEINPNNLFISGESAGGYIAMGVGFIDDSSEVLTNLSKQLSNVPAPNQLYENSCIKALDLAQDIDSMDLSRPNLGDYKGSLHTDLKTNYKIQSVGNLYGGVFNNIFRMHTDSTGPSLYLYHQVCDLIVPFNYSKILAGYNQCFIGFPTYCQNIISRPMTYGSGGIKALIDSLHAQGLNAPSYEYDISNNTYGCIEQVSNPSLSCHALDNYWLRTSNMADYFAKQIDSCSTASQKQVKSTASFSIYPNPASSEITVSIGTKSEQFELILIDVLGRTKHYEFRQTDTGQISLQGLAKGVYTLCLKIEDHTLFSKLVIE